jgi:3,4-dihydroxy 2-butanone 4-phosphate synthase/GTP cyclohydrolase II
MAKDGGVLVRAGHTEAGCDLAKLAGLEPSAVIVEILNEDGTMARKKDLITFAKKYKLKIGTIEDLIKYKTANEKTVKRVSEEIITTDYGEFTSIFYEDTLTSLIHFALIKNKIDSTMPTTVRVHVQNVLTDTIKSINLSTWPLDSALKKISKSKQGALVFITENLSSSHINYLKTTKTRHVNKSHKIDDYRTVGIGAQILSDIGVKDMILLSTPKVYHGINAFGLNVIKYISK